MFLFILDSLVISRSHIDFLEKKYNSNLSVTRGQFPFCLHTQIAKEKTVAGNKFLNAIQKNPPCRLKVIQKFKVIQAFVKFMIACNREQSEISRLIKSSQDLSRSAPFVKRLLKKLEDLKKVVNQSISLLNHFGSTPKKNILWVGLYD